MRRLPPSTTLFPYTTLFRSDLERSEGGERGHGERQHGPEVDRQPPLHLPQVGADIAAHGVEVAPERRAEDRKSTRLNSSHANTSYAVFCLKKKQNFIFLLYL